MDERHKQYFNKMLDFLEKYQIGSISLPEMHNNLFALYELVNDSYKTTEFQEFFHKYWDHIEEIIAVDKVKEFKHIIDYEIIPMFKEDLDRYLSQI